jgi:hypothetical protein
MDTDYADKPVRVSRAMTVDITAFHYVADFFYSEYEGSIFFPLFD